MTNRLAIEGALERGHLWAAMRNGRYWRLRRNGQTKMWKTRPDAFSIPVKAGPKSCARITERDSIATMCEDNWRSADFVVAGSDPNEARS